MTGPLRVPESIRLREVGLRDGLQIEQPIPTAAKLRLLEALVATGARRIEATAFVSPKAVPALADAEEVAAHLSEYPGIEFSALVANPRGAHRAVDAGVTALEYVVSASDGHSLANAHRTTAQALDQVGEVASVVHGAGGTCEVIIAVAWDDPFDGPTPPGGVVALARRAVDSGADRLCLGDTIGTTTPVRMAELVTAVRTTCQGTPLGVHLHDTRGAGLATALAAMQIGVLDLDASIGGLGGCPFAPGASGNIATEELAFLCRECGIETGLDLERLRAAAALAQEVVGRPLESGVLRAGDRSLAAVRR
ncbi:hydroxymethylglutaryl-CoA lyase [Amycolatopsis jiangsuensis]|uniref:Hydroxymethylglutaryl-CoA lyase n=1 Tax=Amycolatopsis jiangsuensis TaxID=1181879 RepID=A0A840J6M3_9PSEU|nr:hydroxymethylglutaryl-CoA lyase [Amycolatopsis jiangsuensis]MBB4689680.1 hydroxymethylglutaryl-CoA lyase [Amycolatopsis jiangsuensis]